MSKKRIQSFKWNDNLSSLKFNIQELTFDISIADVRLVLSTSNKYIGFGCKDDKNSKCIISKKSSEGIC